MAQACFAKASSSAEAAADRSWDKSGVWRKLTVKPSSTSRFANVDARTGAFGAPFNSSEVSARGNLSPAGRSVEWVENPELDSSLTASGFAARENRVNF